jgi:ribonucleotide monophosphatase NagD (HAD superfamily)
MGKPENWLCDIFFKDEIKNNGSRFLMIGGEQRFFYNVAFMIKLLIFLILDRLNTDILFGKKNNLQTLLVETGVHKLDKVQEIINDLETAEVKDEDLVNQIPDFYISKLGDLFDNLK